MKMFAGLLLSAVAFPALAAPAYDTVITNGTVYDGTGAKGFPGWVAIRGDKIAAVGRGAAPAAASIVDAKGQAIAPGFINMQSWATESLIADGRGMSDLTQGVTLEVFGEGTTMGPANAEMKAEMLRQQQDITFPIAWDTMGGYMRWLEQRGISPNIASFVGATTVRVHELGQGDVDPTPEQLTAMQKLVRQAMDEGAVGVGSALIYAPGTYAETPELIALAKASATCGGSYISHIRSEGDHIEEAVDEIIRIARESGGPADIYHLKLSGRDNWGKREAVLKKIADAKAQGLDVRATMYVYAAGATGLDASMPTWVQAGGTDAWIARLKDPATRARVIAEMRGKAEGWENLYAGSGRDPSKILFVEFRNEKLRPLTGKTLAEVMKIRGTSAEDTILDLVIEDGSRVGTIYFLMSEDNVKAFAGLPWVTLGSDAGAPAPEGVFLKSSEHPRAYGNFARFLGHYVRDEKVDSLENAVRRLSGLPAERLKLEGRGHLVAGQAADVVLFDPATITDHSTFQQPQVYSTGVSAVWVNGVQVIRDGQHTGAKPGRFLTGPGFGRCKG